MKTVIRKYHVDIVKKNLMTVVDDILKKNPDTTATIKMVSAAAGQSHTVRVLFESNRVGFVWALRGWLHSDEGIVDWEKLTVENLSPAERDAPCRECGNDRKYKLGKIAAFSRRVILEREQS